MRRLLSLCLAAAGVLLFQAGCVSRRAANPPPPAEPAVASPAAAPPPPPPTLAAPPEPVYRNPKIGIVYLRAHQDAEGRLLGPQVMYQVVDPGGWNIEAVEGGKGYVPAVNLEVPPNLGSPYVVPAGAVPPLPSDSPLLDADRAAKTVMTGLMRPEDRPEAEARAAQAGGGRAAVFDDQAGWLLVPPGPAGR